MRNSLLAGIAAASVFALMVPLAPASAQGACGAGHACGAYRPGQVGQAQNRYRHGGYARGYGQGYGVGAGIAGLAAGAVIGGVIATQNQGYYPAEPDTVYPDQGPGYYDAGPQVADQGDTVAYCQQTYRSYDPASGTYLGYDGLRHPCP
jgi:hypothetical protein